MNKGNLFRRNTLCDQLILHIVINIESLLSGNRKIAEYHLSELIFLCIRPNGIDFINRQIDLGFRIIERIRIEKSWIKSDLSSVCRDFQHIIFRRINDMLMDCLSPVGQVFHQSFLVLAWLCNNRFPLRFRYIQLQILGYFDIRYFTEDFHQLRYIVKLGKTLFHAESVSFRGKLHRRSHFSECRCPGIEIVESVLLQNLWLQIFHHGIALRYRSGTGLKFYITIKFIIIAAFIVFFQILVCQMCANFKNLFLLYLSLYYPLEQKL